MWVVYGLEDPRDNLIFYVGITNNVQVRYIQHIRCEGDNWEKNKRVDDLRRQGLLPIHRTLETMHTEMRARKREVYWIEHYAHLGMPLTNISQNEPEALGIAVVGNLATVEQLGSLPSDERLQIITIAKTHMRIYGKVKRSEIPEQMGKNNRYYSVVKQVLDEEGL